MASTNVPNVAYFLWKFFFREQSFSENLNQGFSYIRFDSEKKG